MHAIQTYIQIYIHTLYTTAHLHSYPHKHPPTLTATHIYTPTPTHLHKRTHTTLTTTGMRRLKYAKRWTSFTQTFLEAVFTFSALFTPCFPGFITLDPYWVITALHCEWESTCWLSKVISVNSLYRSVLVIVDVWLYFEIIENNYKLLKWIINHHLYASCSLLHISWCE